MSIHPRAALIPLISVALLTASLSGCGGGGDSSAVTVRVTPANGTEQVQLGSPISVRIDDGRITSVEVSDGKGRKTSGKLAEKDHAWTSNGKITPGTTYRVRVTAQSEDGTSASSVTSFTTKRADKVNEITLTPGRSAVVGTGMPLSILFDNPVGREERAEIERALRVTTRPRVPVSWGWVRDWSGKDRIDLRPKAAWPAGTKVSLQAALSGLDSGKGGWFIRDYDLDFTVGPDRKAVIDVPGHTLTMYENGKAVGSIKGSAGAPESPTRGGIHTVTSKQEAETLDSATIGYGNQWSLDSRWVTHLTASGTFLHSAPWNKQIGQTNNSHGCFGMTTADAKKVYDFLPVGATVEVKGSTSTKKTEVGNGLEDWQETWQQWRSRSATK